MAYEKQTWSTGDTITAEKLNHIEDGLVNVETTPGPKGDPGDDAKQIQTVVINTDASNIITGGTVTFTDETTVPITVNKAGA